MSVTQEQLAARIIAAREAAQLRQADLAGRVELTQSAVSRIESGQRAVSSLELARIADALDVSVLDLLSDAPTDELLVAARAQHDTRLIGAVQRARTLLEIDQLLTDLGAVDRRTPPRTAGFPRPPGRGRNGAAELARQARSHLGSDEGPLDLLEVLFDDRFGLHVAFMRTNGVDGICASTATGTVIIADADAPLGRRRFTIAHELGHWLAGHGEPLHVDRTVLQPRDEHERWANKFAITFLAPTDALRDDLAHVDVSHESVLRLSMSYGVSYQALVWHLLNNRIIDEDQQLWLHKSKPSEIALRCGLLNQWREQQRPVDPTPPHRLSERVIGAYLDGVIGIGPVADVLGRDDVQQLREDLEDIRSTGTVDHEAVTAPF